MNDDAKAQLREQTLRQWHALKDVARRNHQEASKGKITTAAFCICGCAMGGPAGSDACKMLQLFKTFIECIPASRLPDDWQESVDLLRSIM